MKKSILRSAALAAVGGLLVAAVAPLSAFAATAPAYDTTTDAPVHLLLGSDLSNMTSGTQIDWNTLDGVNLSPNASPADLGDYSWGSFAPVSGATSWIGFLSLPGQERTPMSWKQWGDFVGIGTGVLIPTVYPGYLGNGAPAATKAAGGTYSMGIAYTDGTAQASAHVIKAYYTTINVDPGTGTWTFSALPSVCTVTTVDHTTTTALAANPTTGDVGTTTTLTATVSSDITVPGNVEFYAGSTKVSTVALASGSATKSVTIASQGDNTYSAKFVENTVVGQCVNNAQTNDHFVGSTSSNLVVTGTIPAVQLPPNGPSENALNSATAHGATASYSSPKATLTVDGANNGTTVNVFAYSAPLYLGQLTVTNGSIMVDVSQLPAGDHKIAIVDPTTGDVLAWASFTKTDAAAQPSFQKQINADVANGTTPADGEFSLTNLSGTTVNLTNPALVNGASVVSGQLGSFKVTDLRQVSKPGWTLKTDVAQFVKGSDTIANSALGIAPQIVAQAGTGATAPTLGTAQVSGSASYPWNFATLAAGNFSGVSTYDAALVFTAPAGSPAGTYTSTLTLTLVSN